MAYKRGPRAVSGLPKPGAMNTNEFLGRYQDFRGRENGLQTGFSGGIWILEVGNKEYKRVPRVISGFPMSGAWAANEFPGRYLDYRSREQRI